MPLKSSLSFVFNSIIKGALYAIMGPVNRPVLRNWGTPTI